MTKAQRSIISAKYFKHEAIMTKPDGHEAEFFGSPILYRKNEIERDSFGNGLSNCNCFAERKLVFPYDIDLYRLAVVSNRYFLLLE